MDMVRTLCFISVSFLTVSPVSAETLDAKRLSGLVSGHTWQSGSLVGPGHLYWEWKPDKSVCLRQEATGSCMDTGRWKLDGDSLCYEFSWWGKSSGLNARCVRAVNKGDGRYEMIPVDGVTPIGFTIAK